MKNESRNILNLRHNLDELKEHFFIATKDIIANILHYYTLNDEKRPVTKTINPASLKKNNRRNLMQNDKYNLLLIKLSGEEKQITKR